MCPIRPRRHIACGLARAESAGVGAVLRVVSDERVEGVATMHRGTIVADLMERRPNDDLIGQDPFQREWLWHRCANSRPAA